MTDTDGQYIASTSLPVIRVGQGTGVARGRESLALALVPLLAAVTAPRPLSHILRPRSAAAVAAQLYHDEEGGTGREREAAQVQAVMSQRGTA